MEWSLPGVLKVVLGQDEDRESKKALPLGPGTRCGAYYQYLAAVGNHIRHSRHPVVGSKNLRV